VATFHSETNTKKKSFAVHWFGGGELLASRPIIIPKPNLVDNQINNLEDAKDRKANLRKNRQNMIFFHTTVKIWLRKP
jgi:hypothetical protein